MGNHKDIEFMIRMGLPLRCQAPGGAGAKTGLYMVKVKNATKQGFAEVNIGGGGEYCFP